MSTERRNANTEMDSTANAGTDDSTPMLRVENLSTRFFTDDGQINAVENVSFEVNRGELFGVVGESGSGKSVMAYSILDIVESPGRVTNGKIWFRSPDLAESYGAVVPEAVDGDYVNLVGLPSHVRQRLRGSQISMIFQDPMSSFDPSYTVGEQIAEAVEVQRRARAEPRSVRARTEDYGLSSLLMSKLLPSKRYVREESYQRAVELLGQVGISDPEERVSEYPHQFSGGMLQRAMIAMALAGEPELLIADEPTTALDVTIQAQILNLLMDIQAERGMSIILITHDLGVIGEMCERIGVMYAGEIVERGDIEDIFTNATHPYTQGLLGSIPDVDGVPTRLSGITGNVPSLRASEMGDECYFVDRCPKAMECCLSHPPEKSIDENEGHSARCVLVDRPYDPDKAISRGDQ